MNLSHMPNSVACRVIEGFLLVTVLGGCYYHYRTPGPGDTELARRRSILVTLDAPSPIQFDLPGGQRSAVQVVRQIEGPLVLLSSDSVTLEVRAVRDSTRSHMLASPAFVTLARARVASIEVRAFDPETTVRAAIFTGGVLVLVWVFLWEFTHAYKT